MKIAVTPTSSTAPATGPLSSLKTKVVVVMLAGLIASLKVALIGALNATPSVRSTGVVALTCGAVVSGSAPVVKLHT